MTEQKKDLFAKMKKTEKNKQEMNELTETIKIVLGLSFILRMKNWVLVCNDLEQYDWMEGKK